ncbi:hypothetical protein DFW101_0138 [Solidesulfovibrio carbinoliphilus subsp. oakridgensis]|uniref:EamA domain-containing protein n=1 Tax=Solidesulfovibrio carbinoliphilus subsp. oakridgensis TaxID=694327 RepID=G7QCJ9_9BACT|nr:hypothetical protein [Solidesulfovibrio carbinoliphilus]EHJ46155.1 hypothetical protein DFW101_0138 [Solidesulfovibrio carbinoliphilus subsp. oakridgensis]
MGRLFFGAVCIGFSAVFVKLAGVAPSVSAFCRLGIGGVALALGGISLGSVHSGPDRPT